ncbi:hypothetical protein LGM54_06125 [Burkholderia cenocepacia]|uniref:hypothetical protein n=1 Tax=Burkholderia cenocepacia TaxID=95486 RepID=UPI001CF1F3B4|nr:hypothetical protein [Burkholderia cenocepacia]MCA7962529.1 hypothetical protein [Burkholderia cenocepacia]
MRAPLNSLTPVLRGYSRSVVSRVYSRRRYFEAGGWMVAYGVAIGFLWYGALVAGPYLRSLG